MPDIMPGIRQLFGLKNKVAIVTGGAGFLGRPICKSLASAGSHVAVLDRDDEVHLFAKELGQEFKTQVQGFCCDITSEIDVSGVVRSIHDSLGAVSILVNNAATKTDNVDDFFCPTETFSIETWKKVMDVNLNGMFLMSQAVGREMIKSKNGGSIIQISSIYGMVAPDERIYEGSHFLNRTINTPAVYSASKAGVIGLTKHLAAQWGKHKIRVNAVVPGGIQSGQNTTFQERYSQRVPLGRMANADEILGGILYLASDASSYVTGHSLVIDGGLSIW